MIDFNVQSHPCLLAIGGEDDLEVAGNLLRSILVREPAYPEAAALLRRIEEKAGRERGAEPPQLAAAYRRPVSLEFRDVPMRSVFDGISRQGGLNFTFDKDVRTDQRTTLFARDTPLAEALDMLLTANQLARKVLGGNTPVKQKEYQDIVVRGFFLANAEPKQTMNLLRSMARIRDVHVDEKLNMVVVRDNPEAVRLAERLIRMADQPEPEVMLQVEILEVKRSRLLELGLQWPNQFSLLAPEATTKSHVEGGVIVTDSVPGGRLTIDSLKSITGATVGVSPTPTLNLNKIDGDVNLLANPRIRVRNGEKARVHIGDKVPVITANVTSTGVTSESVAYLDVGLKLDVEPQVYLDAEVAIKVGLEVSNIVQQVKSTTGTLTYQLGSRNASTVLRLKDGETQVLAGLISDEERSSAAKVPGLGDLPLLGRLFASHRDDTSKTEIVLLITPHVIRNVTRPALADGEFYAGTESMASGQPIRRRSRNRCWSGRLASRMVQLSRRRNEAGPRPATRLHPDRAGHRRRHPRCPGPAGDAPHGGDGQAPQGGRAARRPAPDTRGHRCLPPGGGGQAHRGPGRCLGLSARPRRPGRRGA